MVDRMNSALAWNASHYLIHLFDSQPIHTHISNCIISCQSSRESFCYLSLPWRKLYNNVPSSFLTFSGRLAYPYPGISTQCNRSPTRKKLICFVAPCTLSNYGVKSHSTGVFDERTKPLDPISALIRLLFPTLLLPVNAIYPCQATKIWFIKPLVYWRALESLRELKHKTATS